MTPDETLIRLNLAVSSSEPGTSDFDLNPDFPAPTDIDLRLAGVLIAIEIGKGEPQVLLTKRSSALRHHPGQIAFAGGKVEDQDQGSATAAALREAQEEIGLPASTVKVIGSLTSHQTVTGFSVVPVVGVISKAFPEEVQPDEVEELFRVPLSHFLQKENFSVQWRQWKGTRRHYYVVAYGPYYIWGATARILRVLCDRMTRDEN